jgi:hypothetical protein
MLLIVACVLLQLFVSLVARKKKIPKYRNGVTTKLVSIHRDEHKPAEKKQKRA